MKPHCHFLTPKLSIISCVESFFYGSQSIEGKIMRIGNSIVGGVTQSFGDNCPTLSMILSSQIKSSHLKTSIYFGNVPLSNKQSY